jgi:hypothetical protein
MALKWIRGDFKTGNATETATLPVTLGSSKVDPDINAGDSAVLSLSRADLPSDWRTYLKTGDTMVALVDDAALFSSGVIWAGRVNKANATVKGVVNVQLTGLDQHLSKRIITSVYNATDTNPTSGITFTASTWQGVMKAIIQHCFSTTGIPVGSPMPPAILGNVDGTVSGTTYSYVVKNSNAVSYADALAEIRDSLSPGNEYRFVPRWKSSAKTGIVWDAIIGTDSAPHIGEATTRTIQLADNVWKPLSFGQSSSADNIATRIVAQSKAGSGTTGSDFTTKTSTTGTTLLEDQFFNPNVELTTAEMTAQLNSRLAFAAAGDNEATFERSYDTLDELRTMLTYLGNLVTFTGTAEASQFGATMRIVGLSYPADRKIIKVSLLPKAAKYPKLPKDRVSGIGSDYSDSGSSTPLTPRVPPNTPPAYTPPVAPPFQLPKDTHTDPESILTPVDMRHFSGYNELGAIENFYHKQPDVTRSRFNYDTGEMIGLATGSRMLSGFNVASPWNDAYVSTTVWQRLSGGQTHNKDLDIYSVNIVGMFDRDSNPYMNMTYSTVPNADSFKKRIGTIPYSLYSNLEIDLVTFRASIPTGDYSSGRNRAMSIADYNLFCSQDLQTVYVQIMVTTSISQLNSGSQAAGQKSYSTTLSKVLKGVRGVDGVIASWEDLGDILVLDKDTSDERTFFSTAIYEIDGQFHAFGGYLIPLVEDGISAPALNPGYELKFYQHGHTMVNVSNFVYNMEEIDLPGLAQFDTGSINQSVELLAKFPYAINVDYSQKKISLGISRGANGKLSQYFYSDFSNLLNFRKILSTEREQAITSAGLHYTFTGAAEDPFRFRSKAPIFYKNNFFLFNASSTANNDAEGFLYAYTNKQINHIRGKFGFEDTVSGALKLNTYVNINSLAKDSYVVYNSTASSANNLGAFGNYKYRTANAPYETRNVLGMEYFIYNGFLYIICDTTFAEYENATGSTNIKFFYWIGKFAIKDSIL